MNNSTDKSALLREIAIIDYVAGNQCDATRSNFEKNMEQDQTLRHAVADEKEFRANMQEAGKSGPVSMANFDVLLEAIELGSEHSSEGHSEGNVHQLVDSDTSSGEQQTNIVRPTFWKRSYAVAASVAVVGVIMGGFYKNMLAPSFDVLSSKPASEKVDFVDLTKQGRLAKMVLADQVSAADVDALLQAYDLTTFESGAETGALYVVTQKAFSASDISRMRADSRVKEIEIFLLLTN